jgi:putative endopeptidase
MPVVDWTKDLYEFIGGEQIFQPIINFSQITNTLYVPLCCIQRPYFDLDGMGLEYNIANLGFLIAQKMYESIGLSGSKYDYNGNLNNWWNDNDYIIYENFSNKIRKQYEVFAARDNIRVDTSLIIDDLISVINGISICQTYLNDYHRNQQLRYIIVKQKNIEFYIFITYLFKQKIFGMGFFDKYINVTYMINEYAINIALSRLQFFQKIYDIKQSDYMYYKLKEIL